MANTKAMEFIKDLTEEDIKEYIYEWSYMKGEVQGYTDSQKQNV